MFISSVARKNWNVSCNISIKISSEVASQFTDSWLIKCEKQGAVQAKVMKSEEKSIGLVIK